MVHGEKEMSCVEKKKVKAVWKIVLTLMTVVVVVLLLIFTVHKYQSGREYELLNAAGYVNSVSTGEYNLNVCMYGNSESNHTIVGISGMGSSDFAVTVRPFMERFSDEYKIVVIDRAGYGMSDDTTVSQTVEQVVYDYRTVLQKAGCTVPYILMAHSLGGDYATYWENAYPDEIEAVVYFDPDNIPGDITEIDDHPGEQVWWEEPMSSEDPVFCKMGLARVYMEFTDNKPWISAVSQEHADYRKAFWEHSASTFAQNSEASCYADNMKKIDEMLKANDIPKLYIDAAYYTKEDMIDYFGFLYNSGMTQFVEDINPENTAEMDRLWEINGKANRKSRERFIDSYIEKLGNCKYVNIPGDHYIYAYKTDEVEQAVSEFLEEPEK
jgi:pimeloyl-ACP methyl ester carboxylesterase